MSFFAGRLAGKEGAYFLQESKIAVGRLAQKNSGRKLPSSSSPSQAAESEPQPDVLPEILRHSLPSKIFSSTTSESSTLSTGPKWGLPLDPRTANSANPDALNPLRAYVSLPQVTFGPRRWDLPQMEHSVLASTANAKRQDKEIYVNPEKLKAAAEAFSQIGKAFAIASAFVFGGSTLLLGITISKLELHTTGDVRNKVNDSVQPKLDMLRGQLVPIKTWAENTSKKWHLERQEKVKDSPMIKQLSEILGSRPSS